MDVVELAHGPRRMAILWFALLGGPAAWSAHLLASYPLVPVACSAGSVAILHAATAVTVLIAASSGWVGWRECRRLDPLDASGDDRIPLDRARFMARTGMWLGGFFALVTLIEGLPVLFGDPCWRGP
jgi:hypothetical protein